MTAHCKRLDLSAPRYDQTTYEGRAKHFLATTNPLNVLASDEELERAKQIVLDYKEGKEDPALTDDQIWEAKELYDSAFHCQTGEKLFLLGRMSFQVPGNMVITGSMLTFYRTIPAVIFWQGANQGLNALVNYTNRNASVEVTTEQLATAGGCATLAGISTALLFNKIIASVPSLASGMVGRFVPLLAVAAANGVNIPLMRQEEIKHGIDLQLEDGTRVGQSTAAAVTAVTTVIPCRVAMAAPAMIIPPVVMSFAEKTKTFIKNPWLKAPVTVLLTGACLTFSTPLCCAIFPQRAAIDVSALEPPLQAQMKKLHPGITKFYYNKGL